MKRWTIGSIAFFLTLGIGSIATYMFLFDPTPIETVSEQPKPNWEITQEPRINEEFVPEFRDLPDFDNLQFPDLPDRFFDFHNTDGLVRSSETVARNGENWLVMLEKAGEYAIRRSNAKVAQLKTISYPGEETDAQVSFNGDGKPVFGFKNIPNLKPGPVITVYLRPTWDEIDKRNLPILSMKTGYKRELNLNENWYTLRVSHGQSRDGTQVGVLVLENNEDKQIVARNYFERGYGTIIGELLWAGDIDNDGKLDLYFDEFNEKGYFSGGLYLSSHADEGELVKLVALFSYGGC